MLFQWESNIKKLYFQDHKTGQRRANNRENIKEVTAQQKQIFIKPADRFTTL